MAKNKPKKEAGNADPQEDYYKEQASLYSNLGNTDSKPEDYSEEASPEPESFVAPAINPYEEDEPGDVNENKTVIGDKERQRVSVPKTRHKTPIKYTSIRERRVRGRVFLGLLIVFAIVGFWNSCSNVLGLGNSGEEIVIPYIPPEKTEWSEIAEDEAAKWITCRYDEMLPLPLPSNSGDSETADRDSYTDNVSECYSDVVNIELIISRPTRSEAVEVHEFAVTVWQDTYEVEDTWRVVISLAQRSGGRIYHSDMPSMFRETTEQADPVCTFSKQNIDALPRVEAWATAWLAGDNAKMHELAGETSSVVYEGWGDTQGAATMNLLELFSPCLISSSSIDGVYTVFIQANDCSTGADFSISRNILMESLDTPTPRIVAWSEPSDVPVKGTDGILDSGESSEISRVNETAEVCELPVIPTTTTSTTTTTLPPTTTTTFFFTEDLSDEEESITIPEEVPVENSATTS